MVKFTRGEAKRFVIDPTPLEEHRSRCSIPQQKIQQRSNLGHKFNNDFIYTTLLKFNYILNENRYVILICSIISQVASFGPKCFHCTLTCSIT